MVSGWNGVVLSHWLLVIRSEPETRLSASDFFFLTGYWLLVTGTFPGRRSVVVLMAGPNPISVLWSILKARRLASPRPHGSGRFEHSSLDPILAAAAEGVEALQPQADALRAYLDTLATVDPDDLHRDEALAFWINLYNAAALDLARRALVEGHDSVLRIGDGFNAPVATIAGEELSLEGIEHGKIRRFGDPRIHAALVCGSVSCPTLRFEAFSGELLDKQLDDQMRHFLAAGAFVADRTAGVAHLSRVFRWYGADLVRPSRMPTLLPSSKRRIAAAAAKWLTTDDAEWFDTARPAVKFQKYDWGLGCAVRRRE